MRVAYATNIILVLWLIATSYWTNSHSVNSHTLHAFFFPKNNIQEGPQLNLWNGFEIRVINFSLSPQQLCHLFKNCTFHKIFTSANVAATTRKLFEQKNDNMDIMLNDQKRQVGVMIVSSQKKAKGKEITPQRPPFWLGYHALNAIACENGEPLEPTLSICELVKFRMVHDEALEHLEAVPHFHTFPKKLGFLR